MIISQDDLQKSKQSESKAYKCAGQEQWQALSFYTVSKKLAQGSKLWQLPLLNYE